MPCDSRRAHPAEPQPTTARANICIADGRWDGAIALAGDRDLPQIAIARDRLATLPATP